MRMSAVFVGASSEAPGLRRRLRAAFAASPVDRALQLSIVDGVLFAIMAALIFSGRIEPWHVYVTAFGMSIVHTFQEP